MASDKLVSVIITTYNREFDIIERAVKSVISQTYEPLELIVVDDNPKESAYRANIEDGMKKYPQAVYIKHDINSGAQISRNDGIKAAKGDYLAFLDDDDIWFENKLDCQMRCFTENVGLVYCKGYSVIVKDDEEKVIPYNMSKHFINRLTFEDMLYGDYIGTTTQAVISREAIDACGMFDVDMPARQDYEMWIRISRQFECVGAEEYLFYHYIHEGEQISKNYTKILKGFKNIRRKYKKYYSNVAEFHILLLMAKVTKKEKMYASFVRYVLSSGWHLMLAFVLENKELKKRMEIHKNKCY